MKEATYEYQGREKRRRSSYFCCHVYSYLIFGIFVNSSWAQVPTVVSMTPGDKSYNVPVNTNITIRFSTSMNTNNYYFDLMDEYDNEHISSTVRLFPPG